MRRLALLPVLSVSLVCLASGCAVDEALDTSVGTTGEETSGQTQRKRYEQDQKHGRSPASPGEDRIARMRAWEKTVGKLRQ